MKTDYTVYEDLYEADGPQENSCSAGSVLFTILRGTGRIFLWLFKTSLWVLFFIVMLLAELCRSQSRRRRFF